MTFGLHEHWPPISSQERPILPSMSQLHSKAPSLKSAAKEMTEDLHKSEKRRKNQFSRSDRFHEK